MWRIYRKIYDGYESWNIPLQEVFASEQEANARVKTLDKLIRSLWAYHFTQKETT